MSIPKIKLSKDSKKKYKHNFSSLTSTTFDFGTCQPVKCQFLTPNASVNFSVSSAVRLAPMPVPTFGQMKLHTKCAFIPLSDIFPPFDNFLSNTTFRGAELSYVPASLFCCKNIHLLQCLGTFSFHTVFKLEDASYNNSEGSFDTYTFTSKSICTEDEIRNGLYGYLMGMSQYQNKEYMNFVTSESSTGYSDLNSADYVNFFATGASGGNYVDCVRFSSFARRLYKIFVGLGYKINNDPSYKSIMPLLAYFKAYFDAYDPKRDRQFCDTYCFKLINYLSQSGMFSIETLNAENELFFQFLVEELGYCMATESSSYINAHIENLQLQNDDSFGLVVPNSNQTTTDVFEPESTLMNSRLLNGAGDINPLNKYKVYATFAGTFGYDRDSDSMPTFSGIAVQAALRLTRFINKNNVIGQQLDKWFKVHFGYSPYDLQSRFVSSDSMDIDISDVFSTNESADVNLGEYAGKGIGHGSSESYQFQTDNFGYFIAFQCIMPVGSEWYQGEDPSLNALTRLNLPFPEFDALGFEVTPKSVFLADMPVDTNTYRFADGFGYIPRYSGFKVARNIVNGDLALRSTRDSLSAYHLQKLITTDIFRSRSSSNNVMSIFNLSNVVAGTWLRYLTKYPFLINYDRIFYNNDYEKGDNTALISNESSLLSYFCNFVTEDNFIVHDSFKMSVWSELKSISESFDDFSGNDSDVEVTHA